jgi:hypothetical protein
MHHMTRSTTPHENPTMSKASLSSLMALCAALTACSDGPTTHTLTAPDARPSLGEASADAGGSYTIDEPDAAGSARGDAFAQLAGAQTLGAQLAASPRAASGSRASGHVGLAFPANPGIVSEKYSFVALRTDPATPLAAKGQYHVQYTTGACNTIKIHGDVDCMITFGNTARASGPITRVSRDGVEVPINPNGTHAFWVVVDNGEGAGTPDQVSLARFSNGTIARNFCANGFGIVVFANQEGNVQVRP